MSVALNRMRRSKLTLALAVVALLAPHAAIGQVVKNADWIRRPTQADLMAAWPREALGRGQSGRAVIGCEVTEQGTLRSCRTLSEEPAGAGFGSAALAMTPQFLMRPATLDGKPVVSRISIPINFKMPSGAGLDVVSNSPSSRLISNLVWLAAPTYDQVLAVYPEKARAKGVGGVAVFRCKIGVDGGLKSCDLLRSEPKNQGIETAARRLIPLFAAPTEVGDVSLIGSATQLQIAFAADTLTSSEKVVGKPRWVAVPKLVDFVSALPPQAKAAQTYKGRVVMACKVGPGGMLEGCRTDSEEPANLGFGPATVALARTFRVSVWSEEGLPTVGGTIRVPLRWDLDAATVAANTSP